MGAAIEQYVHITPRFELRNRCSYNHALNIICKESGPYCQGDVVGSFGRKLRRNCGGIFELVLNHLNIDFFLISNFALLGFKIENI